MGLDLRAVLKQVIDLTQAAYQRASALDAAHTVETKERNDIVSAVDKFMEQQIVAGLRALYPDHGFVGEEFGAQAGASAYDWLIDPIDGTINFVAGLPLYGTSVALRYQQEPVLGVIFLWHDHDIYWAIKGQGAYRNQQPLHVSATTDLKDSVLTFCLTAHYTPAQTDAVLQVVRTLAPLVRGLRLLVCTVVEAAWVASGLTDGMLNVKPSLGLGSCAGKLLVAEAGGRVTNLQGLPQHAPDTLLVTNGLLHDQIVQALEAAHPAPA